ncbi:MAG: hypothetical protein OXC44_05455 [Proteobacteria bacterium]|nr:hypothetical protein [Pseudomonadota bacterium]
MPLICSKPHKVASGVRCVMHIGISLMVYGCVCLPLSWGDDVYLLTKQDEKVFSLSKDDHSSLPFSSENPHLSAMAVGTVTPVLLGSAVRNAVLRYSGLSVLKPLFFPTSKTVILSAASLVTVMGYIFLQHSSDKQVFSQESFLKDMWLTDMDNPMNKDMMSAEIMKDGVHHELDVQGGDPEPPHQGDSVITAAGSLAVLTSQTGKQDGIHITTHEYVALESFRDDTDSHIEHKDERFRRRLLEVGALEEDYVISAVKGGYELVGGNMEYVGNIHGILVSWDESKVEDHHHYETLSYDMDHPMSDFERSDPLFVLINTLDMVKDLKITGFSDVFFDMAQNSYWWMRDSVMVGLQEALSLEMIDHAVPQLDQYHDGEKIVLRVIKRFYHQEIIAKQHMPHSALIWELFLNGFLAGSVYQSYMEVDDHALSLKYGVSQDVVREEFLKIGSWLQKSLWDDISAKGYSSL